MNIWEMSKSREETPKKSLKRISLKIHEIKYLIDNYNDDEPNIPIFKQTNFECEVGEYEK